jgi:MATE family multidrug resistance protein
LLSGSIEKPLTPLTHRAILAIALPVMLSNISTPLIGVVDTAVVGQIPDPAYVGAVAVGSLVFGFVFWAFGFLRMGTTGLTAQAFGAGENAEINANLVRALGISVIVGVLLILLLFLEAVQKWKILHEVILIFVFGLPQRHSLITHC